jgi:hypothetical protein
MPRYFFDVYNAQVQVEDEEGADFPGLDEARRNAIIGIRSILKAEVEEGKIDLRGEIRIRDEQGKCVLAVPYSAAVEIRT